MTDTDKTPSHRPKPAGGAEPTPIPVKEIRFCVKDGRDIALAGVSINGGKDILRAGEVQGGILTIEYKPWIRHHHLRFTERGELKSQCMIPESWASWTPADDAA